MSTDWLVVQGSAVTILAGVVLAIIRGWLVPRKTLEDVRADRDARVAAAEAREEQWRQAYLTGQDTIRQLTQQHDELLEIGRTNSAVIQALPAAIQLTSSREDPH